MPDVTLTPAMATGIFVLACWGGYQYRRVWKTAGPTWQLWVYGAVAALSLIAVGFLPLSQTG